MSGATDGSDPCVKERLLNIDRRLLGVVVADDVFLVLANDSEGC